MRRLVLGLFLLLGCTAAPQLSEPARARALAYQRRADLLAESGDRAAALHFATRALVVRLADCGYDCPEAAYSFVQLGDLRWSIGEPEHAAQSFAQAVRVLEPHRATHARWMAASEQRLRRACAAAASPPPGCRLLPSARGSTQLDVAQE